MKKFFTFIKEQFNTIVGLFLFVLAFVIGAGGDVTMAAVGPEGGNQGNLPADQGGGTTQSGSSTGGVLANGNAQTGNNGGIATETYGRRATASDNPDFYLSDIDKQIVKIRPMSTPIDQISRYATNRKVDSFICKYYSVGTRPIKTTALSGNNASSGLQFELKVDDPNIFTMDDTIRVVGKKASWDNKKNEYISNPDLATPDVVLCVVGRAVNGNPIVYAINVADSTSHEQVKYVAIDEGSTLIRMGKSCGELDIQTGRFSNLPKPDEQYCQHFAIQVEQSTFDKIAAKEVNWDMSDLEEDALYDMRLTQEMSYLFGDMACLTHSAKDNMNQWFTKGIWWMAGKDVTIGHKVVDVEKVEESGTEGQAGYVAPVAEVSHAELSDDDLIDMSKAIFTGAGTGNKKKVILCGKDVVALFGKIKSEKFRLVSTYERWHLKFTEWETGFGTLYIIHDEMFDTVNMSDCAFCLDPEFLYKATHLSHERSILDLKSAGIRNTDATVLREAAALYLRYPNAHARMKIAAHSAATAA